MEFDPDSDHQTTDEELEASKNITHSDEEGLDDDSINSQHYTKKVVSPLMAKINLPEFVHAALRFRNAPRAGKKKPHGVTKLRMVGTKRDPL